MRFLQMIFTRTNLNWRTGLLVLSVFVMGVAGVSRAIIAQENSPESTVEKSMQTDDAEVESEVSEVDLFVPDFEDQDLVETSKRAWEYRPYQVAVWFCLDGSPLIDAIYNNIAKDVTRRSELLDPSGWDLTTGRAPMRWRNRFIENLKNPEKFGAL